MWTGCKVDTISVGGKTLQRDNSAFFGDRFGLGKPAGAKEYQVSAQFSKLNTNFLDGLTRDFVFVAHLHQLEVFGGTTTLHATGDKLLQADKARLVLIHGHEEGPEVLSRNTHGFQEARELLLRYGIPEVLDAYHMALVCINLMKDLSKSLNMRRLLVELLDRCYVLVSVRRLDRCCAEDTCYDLRGNKQDDTSLCNTGGRGAVHIISVCQ